MSPSLSTLSQVPHVTCLSCDSIFSSSAGSLDYGDVPATVTFDIRELRKCVTVSIENDRVVENTESFSIHLTGTAGRISLSGNTEIQIRDDDREWC